MRFSCRYSFINPPQWRQPDASLYSQIIDQISWLDTKDFYGVTFAEHHFTQDGQLPSLLPAAAAVATRTKRLRIGTNIFVLPLHHPVRVAEDAAVVDILSAGRFDLGVAAGYREGEFAGFGLKISERAGRLEEGIEIIKKCWTETEFDYDGRYYKLAKVRVTPKPVQKPGPRITLGASSEAAARRASRIADDFFPTDNRLWEVYYDECDRIGRQIERRPQPRWRPAFLHVTEDPERDWPRIMPHARYESERLGHGGLSKGTVYGDFGTDEAQLREIYKVVTPDQCVAILEDIQAQAPDYCFEIFPILPGMDVNLAQSSLELFASKVIPTLQQKANT
jgi:alkanesulfonate monooxygenase SsuD/methylene tetrahydromethanopterin reductase-like flavin-dependent oxidoreductase (luciferase family)